MVSEINSISIHRASARETETAWSFVQEYYDAARVVMRENHEEFAAAYFGEGSGIWLAWVNDKILGCIALRPLSEIGAHCGEIKRLYVRPEFRGRGIAQALLNALESYATSRGYEELYLDTAADMRDAARLYECSGYQHCARYNENPQAAIFMKKRVRCHNERVSKK